MGETGSETNPCVEINLRNSGRSNLGDRMGISDDLHRSLQDSITHIYPNTLKEKKLRNKIKELEEKVANLEEELESERYYSEGV